MRFYVNWIERGFRVEHRPGISRAWVRVEKDGRQLILTDPGGFDLPCRDGPFQVCMVSRDNEMLDGPVQLGNRLSLARWLRSRSAIPIPTDPKI